MLHVPKHQDQRPILHKDITNIKMPIIILCGKKGSGKSTTLITILENSINKKNPGCSVHIFSSTAETDPIIKEINKFGDKNKYVSIFVYNDMFEGKRNIMLDLLNTIIEEKKEEENTPKNEQIYTYASRWEKKEDKLKSYDDLPYICARHIIIIDDMTHI